MDLIEASDFAPSGGEQGSHGGSVLGLGSGGEITLDRLDRSSGLIELKVNHPQVAGLGRIVRIQSGESLLNGECRSVVPSLDMDSLQIQQNSAHDRRRR